MRKANWGWIEFVISLAENYCMSNFPTEYYFIIGFILLAPVVIIGTMYISKMGSSKNSIVDIKADAHCPSCSQDLMKQINEKMDATASDTVRIVCINCKAASIWDTSGFPPTLIGSDKATSSDGISKNLKEKYGR